MEYKINPVFKKLFLKLMSDPIIQLPKRGGKEYTSSLQELYDFYIEQLSFISQRERYAIKNLCDKIIQIVSLSNQDQAYLQFKELMITYTKYKPIHIIKDNLPVDGYGVKNVNLFRVRKESSNREFYREEIFHQPIDQYRYINAYRYNLTATPSLYLSSTIQCCLKELGLGMDDKLIGAMYRVDTKKDNALYIIDFGVRPLDFIKAKGHYVEGYSYHNYLFTYPLLAACSFIASNKKGVCIPEYAITNLLLRWLVENHNTVLCGIRYFSCHNATYIMDEGKEPRKEDNIRSFTKRFINYVFPIEGDAKKGDSISNKLNQYFVVNKPKLSCDYITIQDFERHIKQDTRTLKRVKQNKEAVMLKK